MSVHLLISPPASGKTHYCLARVLEQTEGQRPQQIWVILPDRLQANAFRERLAAKGSALGVRVETFAGLYAEILEQAGQPVPLASDALLQRLARQSIDEVDQAGRLRHFRPIRDKTGFLLSLRGRFAELKRARIFPDLFLSDSLEDGDPARIELARIYLAYQQRLQALNWADEEGLGWLAVLALEDQPSLLENIPLLVLDGFDSFVATQLRTLRLLDGRVPEILVTLPGSPEMGRQAHRRFEGARRALADALNIGKMLDPSPTWLPHPLALLEGGLFESSPAPISPSPAITMFETRSPAEEAREALRWLKARCLREGLSPGSCALVVPDVDAYRPHLRLVAAEYGLRLRYSQGEVLAGAPSIDALLGLLRLPLQQYSPSPTLALLRSPYFDLGELGFEERHTETLENVSRFGQVVGGLDQWEQTLDALTSRSLPGEIEALRDDASLPSLPAPDEARALKEALQGLATRLRAPGPRPLRVWLAWLQDLLQSMGYFRSASTQRDEAALTCLQNTLQDLSHADTVTVERDLEYEDLLAQLIGALETARYDPGPRCRGPAIQVLSVIEARGVRYDAVAILGLSEGLFPQVERADPFLNEELRASLGLEPRLGREQAGLFYQSATRANRALLMTRPYMSEGGEPWEASPFWAAAKRMLEQEPARIRPHDSRPLAQAGSLEEALFWSARRLDHSRVPDSVAVAMPGAEGRWAHILRARQLLIARLAPDPAGPFDGDLQHLSAKLREANSEWRRWSPSALEAYSSCPHRFFTERVLNLEAKEAPEPGFDAAQLGSMLHAILEKTYAEASDPSDEESLLDMLEHVARREFEVAPARYGFRINVTWEIEKARLLELLRENITALVQSSRGWKPVSLELPFGIRGTPALELEVEGFKLEVRGLIDRLDRDSSGRLRVIDYKTGGSHLAARDLENGRRLQLPLYAMAAEIALDLGTVVEGFYWYLRGARPGGLKLSRFEGAHGQGVEGAAETACAHAGSILRGVHSGGFTPRPPEGGCPSYCPAASWCWRYRPGF